MSIKLITAFISIICVPFISALIYARHRKAAGIFEKICVYGVYAVVIRLLTGYALGSLLVSLGAKFDDGTYVYLLLASVIAVLLPYIHLIIAKYIEVGTEIKGRHE